jgi:hypothetical protein
MRQLEPEEFPRTRGIAFDHGRSGLAGLNATHVDALNDPAVRKEFENLACRCRPRTRSFLTHSARGKAEIEKWWPMIKAANVKAD